MRAPAEFGGADMYSTWSYTEAGRTLASRTCSTLPIHKATGSCLLIGMPSGIPDAASMR